MAKPVSISLSKFTASVQAAVKAAIAKHPKFNLQVPNAISVSYLIRGVPVPDEIASKMTLGETQAFGPLRRHPAAGHRMIRCNRAKISGASRICEGFLRAHQSSIS